MRFILCATAALLLLPPTLPAQQGYRQPPEPIRQLLDAEPTPTVRPSPTGEWLLVLERRALPTIAEVAAPELRLAGVRIDPRTNGRSREAFFRGLVLQHVPARGSPSTEQRRIAGPPGARIADVSWSGDGTHIAFSVVSDAEIALWVAEVATGRSRRASPLAMNAAFGPPCRWVGSEALLCRTVPRDRVPLRPASPIPGGPIIQESEGRPAPNRTYEDLLRSPADEVAFEHYFRSQITLVALAGGAERALGAPGIYESAEPSPDGKWVLVRTVHRPYSYVVPVDRFPLKTEVWGIDGAVVRALADRGAQEELSTSFDAVPAGPRDFAWRGDAPATLLWAEALDGGDPATPAPKRDRVLALDAPFAGPPGTVAELELRFAGAIAARPDLLVVDEQWWRTRRRRTWIVDPSTPAAAPRALFDRSTEDRYGDPGELVTMTGPRGAPVLRTSADGRSAYLAGAGASPEGDRPFLDRVDLATGKTERLWRTAAPYYEQVVTVLDTAGRRLLTRRESVKDAPNYFLRELAGGRLLVREMSGDRAIQLTHFRDPAPQFAGLAAELITYPRADGVQLSARLYLPPGYDRARGPLPFVVWAYPEEFKSAAAAAQVRGSPYRFTRPSGASHLFLLTQGYGVLDGPTMPIVGEGNKEPNDTYVSQLVASAAAAVEKIVAMGVADRQRIAVGGHSYGAFMTANLLAHSRLFRAGVALSGAYNRTLTPFGFQAEERPYWQAREVYRAMSPFDAADSIAAPLLLIHGTADDNAGTFPIQSERFFQALKGLGKQVRYVQLPAEAHGYRARESVGHVVWEMVEWMERWVKGKQ